MSQSESAKRSLIEEEQCARIRKAALELEQRLLDRHREGDDTVESQLTELRITLERVGREPGYVETQTIETHERIVEERRVAAEETEKKRRA